MNLQQTGQHFPSGISYLKQDMYGGRGGQYTPEQASERKIIEIYYIN